MSRFTIFTILLVLTIGVVTADLAVRDYYNEDSFEESAAQESEPEPLSAPDSSRTETSVLHSPEPEAAAPPQEPPLPPVYTPPPPSSTITDALVLQAGFQGTLKEEHFEGKVYELLDITKFSVDGISYYKMILDGNPVVSFTEIALRDEIRALQLYSLLQNKTKPYIDLSLNETNAYGDRSFYINHAKKPNEAFLAVKIGKMIYAIAYVKVFHPEVKKLIQLLIP